MSMLRCFFEIGADSSLFDGLYISQKSELCEKYMGEFPVLFLSLKNVDGLTFEDARYHLTELVGREASRFRFLLDSHELNEDDKDIYRVLPVGCDQPCRLSLQRSGGRTAVLRVLR